MKSKRPQILLVVRSIVLNSSNEILFIKRSSDDEWKANKWEIPGGKLDEGQDISHALEREVFEETGLLINPIDRLAYYESSILTKGKYKGLTYISLIGISNTTNEEIKLSQEHSDYIWLKYEESKKLDLTEETSKALIALKLKLIQ